MAQREGPARKDSATALDLSGRKGGYVHLATRPLHILLFLVPLIALYEYGAWAYLGSDGGEHQPILAQRMLSDLFSSLGVTVVHLPAILAIVVLLLWHLFVRDRWRVRPTVVLGMWAEAAVWTAPLLVLGVILAQALGIDQAPTAALSGVGASVPIEPKLGESITIALGAGLYEELLFRLLGMTIVLLVFEDLLRMKRTPAIVLGIVLTSVAFSLYHAPSLPDGGFHWPLAIYYTVAGAYFGLVFVTRGFGIAVGVHALYDMVALVDPWG